MDINFDSTQQQLEDFRRQLAAMQEVDAKLLEMVSAVRLRADMETIHRHYNQPPWHVRLANHLSRLAAERLPSRTDIQEVGEESNKPSIVIIDISPTHYTVRNRKEF